MVIGGKPSAGLVHACAFVADGGGLRTGLRVVDIADPTAPVEIAFLPLSVEPQAEGLIPARVEGGAAANRHAYMAAGTAGLRVVDVTDLCRQQRAVHPAQFSQ